MKCQATQRGNYAFTEHGKLVATVSNTRGGWTATFNYCGKHYKLTEPRGTFEEVQLLVEGTKQGLDENWHPVRQPSNRWQKATAGHMYRRTKSGVISVKLAKSGAFFLATNLDIGALRWYRTQGEAQQAADRLLDG